MCVKIVVPPGVYRMVQLGEVAREDYMFNMTWQTDDGNKILDSFNGGSGKSMHDDWPMQSKLRERQINLRLYNSADGAVQFVCAMYVKRYLGAGALSLRMGRHGHFKTLGR